MAEFDHDFPGFKHQIGYPGYFNKISQHLGLCREWRPSHLSQDATDLFKAVFLYLSNFEIPEFPSQAFMT